MDVLPPEQWPSTVEDTVGKLLTVLKPQQQQQIRDTNEKRVICFCHGLGTWIRNQFGLWRGNQKLLKSCSEGSTQEKPPNLHPDSASMVIVNALWRRLREMPDTTKKEIA
jgi:hypothetical protein